MPKAFPKEFRRDVVEVAPKREAPVAQVARDFGILCEAGADLEARDSSGNAPPAGHLRLPRTG